MSDLSYLKEELNKIKSGEDSFLGIDGGNIESKIWVCGIEFGGTLKEMEDYYKNSFIVKSDSKDNTTSNPYRTDCPKGYEESTYDKCLSLFYRVIFGKVANDKVEYVKDIDSIFRKKLYNKDSNIFKLNLFPIAKKDTGWNPKISKLLYVSKKDYYGKIFDNRKIFIKKLVRKNKFKTIICTSTNGLAKEFKNSFFEKDETVQFSCEYIETPETKEFKISKYYSKNITLIIIPFLGRCYLNSYDDVIFMAEYLKEHYLKELLFKILH